MTENLYRHRINVHFNSKKPDKYSTQQFVNCDFTMNYRELSMGYTSEPQLILPSLELNQIRVCGGEMYDVLGIDGDECWIKNQATGKYYSREAAAVRSWPLVSRSLVPK